MFLQYDITYNIYIEMDQIILKKNNSSETVPFFLNSTCKFHCPPLTMLGRWWWNYCTSHAAGWSACTTATGIPISVCIRAALLRSSPPADSDGFDSFLEWPPVLTPIQPGDSGKPWLARHISARQTRRKGKVIAAALGPCRHLNSFYFFEPSNWPQRLNVH